MDPRVAEQSKIADSILKIAGYVLEIMQWNFSHIYVDSDHTAHFLLHQDICWDG